MALSMQAQIRHCACSCSPRVRVLSTPKLKFQGDQESNGGFRGQYSVRGRVDPHRESSITCVGPQLSMA